MFACSLFVCPLLKNLLGNALTCCWSQHGQLSMRVAFSQLLSAFISVGFSKFFFRILWKMYFHCTVIKKKFVKNTVWHWIVVEQSFVYKYIFPVLVNFENFWPEFWDSSGGILKVYCHIALGFLSVIGTNMNQPFQPGLSLQLKSHSLTFETSGKSLNHRKNQQPVL